ETMRLDTGLVVELWNKGMLWDKLIGTHWLPLVTVKHTNQEGMGQWLSLDSELIMKSGEVLGTQAPTGHTVFLDARFELPYDLPESEAASLQNKLEELNKIMDQEVGGAYVCISFPSLFSPIGTRWSGTKKKKKKKKNCILVQ
ncbi:hypothetical protein CAPTEDRAFT_120488, partial [Capitella teleta]